MQVYRNGHVDAALAHEIHSHAEELAGSGSADAAQPIAALLGASSEEIFDEGFVNALHHYTALPYPRVEALALRSTRRSANPLHKLFSAVADRLLHARILPLWRWLLWHQGSLNRSQGDALRFERTRALKREAELAARITQLEHTLATHGTPPSGGVEPGVQP